MFRNSFVDGFVDYRRDYMGADQDLDITILPRVFLSGDSLSSSSDIASPRLHSVEMIQVYLPAYQRGGDIG